MKHPTKQKPGFNSKTNTRGDETPSLLARQDSQTSLSSSTSSFPADAQRNTSLSLLATLSSTLSCADIPKLLPLQRNVLFAEDRNVYHDLPCLSPHETVWYTDAELQELKVKNKAMVKVLWRNYRQRKNANVMKYDCKSWISCLERAYQGLVYSQNTHEDRQVLACSRTTLTASMIGVDQWVVPCRRLERLRRRRQIWRHIRDIQHATQCKSASEREAKIGQVSRAISRPSRLYAQFLADISHPEYAQSMHKLIDN